MTAFPRKREPFKRGHQLFEGWCGRSLCAFLPSELVQQNLHESGDLRMQRLCPKFLLC